MRRGRRQRNSRIGRPRRIDDGVSHRREAVVEQLGVDLGRVVGPELSRRRGSRSANPARFACLADDVQIRHIGGISSHQRLPVIGDGDLIRASGGASGRHRNRRVVASQRSRSASRPKHSSPLAHRWAHRRRPHPLPDTPICLYRTPGPALRRCKRSWGRRSDCSSAAVPFRRRWRDRAQRQCPRRRSVRRVSPDDWR